MKMIGDRIADRIVNLFRRKRCPLCRTPLRKNYCSFCNVYFYK
jgi:hypothetical protein